jgi:hypothetical protein
MQGSRGPGLLMGFNKAKLAPPPVRKFAPSLKPQAPKPVVLAVTQELDSAISNDCQVTGEVSLDEREKLNAINRGVEHDHDKNSSSVLTAVSNTSVSNIPDSSSMPTPTLDQNSTGAAVTLSASSSEPNPELSSSALSVPPVSKKTILPRPKKTVRINVNTTPHSSEPVNASTAVSDSVPNTESADVTVTQRQESFSVPSSSFSSSSSSSSVKRVKSGKIISAPSSSKSKSSTAAATEQGNDESAE